MSLFVSDSSKLIAPHGGRLVDLTIPAEALDGLKAYASQLPSIQISPRSVCDLELLATGAFSPLDRFMSREDHRRVVHEMRLRDGHLFPIPVTLPVEPGPRLHLDRDIALRNNEYELLAILTIDEIYEWDRTEVAEHVFGTQDLRHPLVAELHGWGSLNISGRLQILHLPNHFDFQDLRLTLSQARARLAAMGRKNVVAYQPLGRLPHLDEVDIERAIAEADGVFLLQPAVGLARLGNVDHFARIRLYKALVERCAKPDQSLLALLPLASRLAGPREALWQALVCRNYGANHLIVSRDHASPGYSSEREAFYKPHAAQKLVAHYSQELRVKMVPGPGRDDVLPTGSEEAPNALSSVDHDRDRHRINGRKANEWYGHDEIATLLSEIYLPRHRQGICIWFTGLSGSGKSTTAEMLTWLLLQHGRRVTVLDGDVVRTHLSKGLSFDKEDRDTNVRRIGFVASELVLHGGVVICAVVSPYRVARNDVRNMIGEDQFVEVFVDTPLEVCEARDVKGMYAKARRGEIKGFTGIDDPYEPPLRPEIRLDTVKYTPQENASFIIEYLIEQGFISATQAHG